MNKIFLIFLIFICVSFSQGFANDTLVVVYTSNNLGSILDCGCGNENYGGFPRKKSAIDSLRKKFPNLILVDTGNFLTSYSGNFLDNEYILRAYKLLEYDFISPALFEGNNGEDYFVKRISQEFNLVSANLVHTSVKPISIKMQKEIRALFTGLYEVRSLDDSIFALPHTQPMESLKEMDKRIKNLANLKILLCANGNELEEKYGLEWLNLNFDLVIGGNFVKPKNGILIGSNGTRYVECGYNGEFIGKVTIIKSGRGYNYKHELIKIDEKIPDDKMMLRLMREYKRKR
ncbi:MAG: hypothetical protein DWQ06_14545 [Calditrichaeota bacterium]|nr:MAG: hypothetical protein DWQ06_14545 [Calditrichota bacterium]